MGKLTSHADYHKFVGTAADLVELNTEMLTAKGYTPTDAIAKIRQELTTADASEAAKLEAFKVAEVATDTAEKDLATAYKPTSSMIKIIEGYLGSDHPLVKELKSMRN
jgi:type IV secretory pathway protease TraF